MPRSRHVLAMLLVIAIITTGFFLSYDDAHRPQVIVNHDQTKFMVPLSGQQPISAQQAEQETYLTYLPHRYALTHSYHHNWLLHLANELFFCANFI